MVRTKSKGERLVELGPWVGGVNEIGDDSNLAQAELREAVNADIKNKAGARRRPGYTLHVALTEGHSLRAHEGEFVVVDDGWLIRVKGDKTKEQLLHLSHPTARFSYEAFNNELWGSNGVDSFRLRGWTLLPWADRIPNPPRLGVTAGALAAGEYGLFVSFLRDVGNGNWQESGTSDAGRIQVNASEGIWLSYIDQEPGCKIRVYITPTNGDVYYHVADLVEGTTNWLIANVDDIGKEAAMRYLRPLPAGEFICRAFGRLWSLKGDMLYASQPGNFGAYAPAENFFKLPKAGSFLLPVVDGLFVGADNVYFFAGTDPAKMTIQEVQSGEANWGSGLAAKGEWLGGEAKMNGWLAYWDSKQFGPSFGLPGGKVDAVRKDKRAGRDYSTAVSYFRERKGLRQIGTTGASATATSFKFGDQLSAVVVKKNGQIVQ